MSDLQETRNRKKENNLIMMAWENLEVSIGVATLATLTVICFMQVVARYVFQYSFRWSEEISRFLVVWCTFGGSAYAFRKGAHVSITFVVDRLPGKVHSLVWVFSRLATILFFAVLGYNGWLHTIQQFVNKQVAPATRLPVAIPYSAVPIGCVLIILRLIYQLIAEIRKQKVGDKQ